MSRFEDNPPISRRALGHQSLRLVGMGALLSPVRESSAVQPQAAQAGTRCWLAGQAVRVVNPDALEFARHDANGTTLHLRGRSYSHNTLIASVTHPTSVGQPTHLRSIQWTWQAQTGVAVQALAVLDGERTLETLRAPALQSAAISFEDGLPIAQHLVLRWEVAFADTQRELTLQHISCTFV